MDIIPARLGVAATNLAVGGGEAIEAYAAVRRALACPDPPRRVVISFDAAHFVRPDLFWDRSVRFGALDHAELARAARRLRSAWATRPCWTRSTPTGCRAGCARCSMRRGFRASISTACCRAAWLLRWWDNRQPCAPAWRHAGNISSAPRAGSDVVAIEGHLDRFTPLPVLDAYFDRMLALLAARHIETDFVAMPLNAATARGCARRCGTASRPIWPATRRAIRISTSSAP